MNLENQSKILKGLIWEQTKDTKGENNKAAGGYRGTRNAFKKQNTK